ncbi:hypothetical protein BD311DRAFT_768929 [Dichomitus squalens]|uniref:Uncharacterized protein n=1 Tax=Dichomitus squalens TaxID=114155 RepID=A0A4V2JZ03_9APHY|nr:hypothetical protein BD311DRAFT_768929 [Dichomitus squalens]
MRTGFQDRQCAKDIQKKRERQKPSQGSTTTTVEPLELVPRRFPSMTQIVHIPLVRPLRSDGGRIWVQPLDVLLHERTPIRTQDPDPLQAARKGSVCLGACLPSPRLLCFPSCCSCSHSRLRNFDDKMRAMGGRGTLARFSGFLMAAATSHFVSAGFPLRYHTSYLPPCT